MHFQDLKTDIGSYIQGKKWYYYAPGWIFGVYIFFALLGFSTNGQMPFVISIAYAFNFTLHELAHIVTAFLPPILTASAGSLSEILLGAILIVVAFKSRGYFASMICALWFMLACQSAGVYMADARAQKLSLVSLGAALSGSDTALHDWHFVFGQLHLLQFDTFIGWSVRIVGDLVGLAGLAFAAWLMYQMAATEGRLADDARRNALREKLATLPVQSTKPVGNDPLGFDVRAVEVASNAARTPATAAEPVKRLVR